MANIRLNYIHAIEYASITPNVKRLRAFQKVDLKAGESKTLTFTLDKNDLAFVNADLKTVTEPGDFDVMIGDKKATFSYNVKTNEKIHSSIKYPIGLKEKLLLMPAEHAVMPTIKSIFA